jgi:hypothetical protein
MLCVYCKLRVEQEEEMVTQTRRDEPSAVPPLGSREVRNLAFPSPTRVTSYSTGAWCNMDGKLNELSLNRFRTIWQLEKASEASNRCLY